jgi:hypothetical protein
VLCEGALEKGDGESGALGRRSEYDPSWFDRKWTPTFYILRRDHRFASQGYLGILMSSGENYETQQIVAWWPLAVGTGHT